MTSQKRKIMHEENASKHRLVEPTHHPYHLVVVRERDDCINMYKHTDLVKTINAKFERRCKLLQLSDGRLAICCEGTIELLDVETEQCQLLGEPSHNGWQSIEDVWEIIEMNGKLVSFSRNKVEVWNIYSGECCDGLDIMHMKQAIQFSVDKIAISNLDGKITILTINDSGARKEETVIGGHIGTVISLGYGKLAISHEKCKIRDCQCDKTLPSMVRIWDTETNQVTNLRVPDNVDKLKMILLSDGRLAVCCSDGTIRIWNNIRGWNVEILHCGIVKLIVLSNHHLESYHVEKMIELSGQIATVFSVKSGDAVKSEDEVMYVIRLSNLLTGKSQFLKIEQPNFEFSPECDTIQVLPSGQLAFRKKHDGCGGEILICDSSFKNSVPIDGYEFLAIRTKSDQREWVNVLFRHCSEFLGKDVLSIIASY
jgi:WD40 repeat protein